MKALTSSCFYSCVHTKIVRFCHISQLLHVQQRKINENSVFEGLFFFLIEALTSFFDLLTHSESFPCGCRLCDEEVAEGGRVSP